MSQRRSRMDIGGMSCANCAQTIAGALESLDGVSAASASFATDEATVEYDPDAVSLARIVEAVEDAGYTPVTASVTVGITDMTCANCSETVEDALERAPGVVGADVNVATDEARVTYNPAETDREALYGVIEAAGYSPVREDGGGDDGGERRDAARTAAVRRQLRLTLFGAALSAPLLAFLADRLLFGGLLPEAAFGVPLGWVEFLLATPVQLVLGRPFYRNAY
ncbi:MAG: copper ion binding protein, partial [Halobacteriaceae archaeon]